MTIAVRDLREIDTSPTFPSMFRKPSAEIFSVTEVLMFLDPVERSKRESLLQFEDDQDQQNCEEDLEEMQKQSQRKGKMAKCSKARRMPVDTGLE